MPSPMWAEVLAKEPYTGNVGRMVEKVCLPSCKGSELGSTDKGSNGEVTACYKLVGPVEWVDLGYFIKLHVKDGGESSAETFLYFRYFCRRGRRPTSRTKFVRMRTKAWEKGTNRNHIRALPIFGVIQMGILGHDQLICGMRIDDV